jgi:hypothetical protein
LAIIGVLILDRRLEVKRTTLIILTFFLLTPLTHTQDREYDFDEEAASSYIRILASDSMEGRKSGQPGGERAEEYIAGKFKEWGLEPSGDNGTFFQNLTLEHRHVQEGVVLEIVSDRARRRFYYGDDWRVGPYSGSGHFTSEVVFVGYGVHAPQKGYDDYADVDVRGKIVLLSTDTPSWLKARLSQEAQISNRVKTAQEMGARGLMSFEPDRASSRYSRFRLRKEVYRPDFVILSVEERIPDYIFKDLPTQTSYLIGRLNSTAEPMSFHTNVKVFVSVSAFFDEARPARNVVAKIEGSDTQMKEEFLIIGAHMDHLGIDPLGEVMNGANDNASGTAVVMEAARVMSLNQKKPERTVIFALWAGEEQGLWGSRYYVDHPLCPLEKTIAYINLDMVGIGGGRVPFEGAYYAPEIWEMLRERLPPDILDYVSSGRGGPRGSDHASFLRRGIPGFYITQPPILKYHHSRDDSDLIDPSLLKKTGDFILAALKILASEPQSFIHPKREETYHLRYQKLINFRLPSLNSFVENHKDTRNSHVDIQLSLVDEEKLEGDNPRMDVLKRILSASEGIKSIPGLTFYSSTGRLYADIHGGKTTVLPGLKGVNSLADDPRWAQLLAKQGIFFVLIDDPTSLLGNGGLREEGKRIVKRLNESGLLIMAKDFSSSQAEAILEASGKPLIFLSRELPEKEVLSLIKQKKAALGLILGEEDLPSAYFRKLHKAKESLGTDHLLVVNERCLWAEEGKSQLLDVFSEILKAHYASTEISQLFSGTFLRILGEVRGESQTTSYFYIPH